MKKVLWLLQPILSDLKWYRKKQGGIWHKIRVNNSEGGMYGAIVFWTKAPQRYKDVVIVKTEEWQ